MKSFEIQCVGYKIAADWYDGTNDKVLLTLIGYTSNKNSYQDLLSAINENTGMSILVIDYSGHGKSPFELPELTPAHNFLEVVAAFDWIKDNHPDKKISVMGTSYGGFLATQLTKYRNFEKLVLRVPALYHPEDFYTKWKNIDRRETDQVFRKDKTAVNEHPLLKRAQQFKGKTYVMVHEFDELVPRETTDAFINAFKAQSHIAQGFEHSFSDQLGDRPKILAYQKVIFDWLNQ